MNRNDIKKYLEGNTTGAELEQVRNWIKNSENDPAFREIMGEIWANSQLNLVGEEPDFEQMLSSIHHRINSQPINFRNAPTKKKPAPFFNWFSKVAAILVLPLLLTSIYLYFNPMQKANQVASASLHEIYTKPGTRTKIELPDGTLVWMNDGTTLRYPEKFSGSNREVYLDGEAYFEVKANPENPFVVNNPMMNTVVTGTKFNLNAYSVDQYFEATLKEGKVNLEKDNQNLVLKPGDQIQYDVKSKKIVQKNVDPTNASAWIDGRLVVKDEKLEIAIKKLARWYNVEIIVAEPELNGYVLTGTFQNEKLDQTLKLISLALPVKFEFKKAIHPTELQRTIYMKKK